MKSKKFFRILIIVLLLVNIMLPAFADVENFSMGYFEDKTVPDSMSKVVDNSFVNAISIVRIVGIGISVVILIVIACKYMLSAPGDRADIKKNAVPFVIGAVVLFGASNLLGIIIDVGSEFGKINP